MAVFQKSTSASCETEMLQVLRAQVQVRVQVPDPQVQVQVQVLETNCRVQPKCPAKAHCS